MKINEIFNLEKMWQEFDTRLNPEIEASRHRQDVRYKKIAQKSKGETPVKTSDPKVPIDQRYNTEPSEDDIQTSGYRGRESVKKRSGVPHKQYNKRIENGEDFHTAPSPDFNRNMQQLPK